MGKIFEVIFKVEFETTRFPVYFQIGENKGETLIKIIQVSKWTRLTQIKKKFEEMLSNDDIGLVLNFKQLKKVLNEIEKRFILKKLE